MDPLNLDDFKHHVYALFLVHLFPWPVKASVALGLNFLAIKKTSHKSVAL